MGLFDRTRDNAGGKLPHNLTERSRRVLDLARSEAVALGHEYVGTEHLLLGLLREGEGVAAAVVLGLRVDSDALRARAVATLQRGAAHGGDPQRLPFTSRTQAALRLADDEARALHHSYVGTEHLLLGLLREERGIGAQLLVDAGVTLDAARAETLRLLGGPAPSPGTEPPRN